MRDNYFVAFYVQYPYYFPHFLPIYQELKKRDKKVLFVLSNRQNSTLMEKISQENKLDYIFGEEKLFEYNFKYIFFANYFDKTKELSSKTIFLDHGIGTKFCDYGKALQQFDTVLVEGEYRYKKLELDYPNLFFKVKKVGFSKLDSIINLSEADYINLYKKYGLDIEKKSILYAPTFFPSSIEKMSNRFPDDFKDYNIIVKPHYLSLSRNRYKSQRKKFQIWSSYSNCKIMGVEEYNLVPFLAISDIMISDESSAIFEFTALNKPVVLNRFLKLRLSYRLNPAKFFKRLDSGIDSYRKIGDNANNYKEMVEYVYENLNNPDKYKRVRREFTKDLCGDVDGQASKRIVDELY